MGPPCTQIKVACGGEHTLALDRRGTVHSAGVCGLKMSEAVQALATPPLTALAAGAYHNIAVTAKGGALAWGCGVFGTGSLDGCIPALGQDPRVTQEEVTVPRHVRGLPPGTRVVAAAAGGYHSVLLTEDLKVFTFGAAQLGQLARPTVGGWTDSALRWPSAAGLPVDAVPAEVDGLPSGEGSEVRSVGAGFYNTLVTCRSGALLCAGENQNAQCGQGLPNLHSLRQIPELANETVVAADGGYCHTLALSASGTVFSLGCGEDGQRGAPEAVDAGGGVDTSQALPPITAVELPGARKAVAVAAGLNHSLAIDEKGEVWGWGSNEYGQLGVPGDGPQPLPVRMPGLPTGAVAVSAGSTHSAVLGPDGRVHTLGNAANGQLGTGSDQGWPAAARARGSESGNPNAPGHWDLPS